MKLERIAKINKTFTISRQLQLLIVHIPQCFMAILVLDFINKRTELFSVLQALDCFSGRYFLFASITKEFCGGLTTFGTFDLERRFF